MGLFVRVTLAVALAIVLFAVLLLVLKLLVVAALIAAVAIGGALLVRFVACRLGKNRCARVTALTARR